VKTEARTGAADVLREAPDVTPDEFADAGVRGEVGFDELFGPFESPTFTKLNFSLQQRQLNVVGKSQICVPEYAVRTDTEILQDEPDAEFVVLVMQTKRTRA
jgi:hypothetical protein